ncbi:MAG: helix-turn-helix domain-containing protein [Bacteroidales bacterium]
MFVPYFFNINGGQRDLNTNIMNLIDLSKECPDITFAVKAGDLLEMVEFCVKETRKELERQITDSNTETYPSPKQVAKILDVDVSTLWRWNKQGYLCPIEIGGKRRYRMSDIKKILEGSRS